MSYFQLVLYIQTSMLYQTARIRYLKFLNNKIIITCGAPLLFLIFIIWMHKLKVFQSNNDYPSAESVLGDMFLTQLDASRKFKYRPFTYTGTNWNNTTISRVGIATQCSLDHAGWIGQKRAWFGVVSVSIYVPGLDFYLAVQYITYLRKCNQFVREQVSFHFVFPITNQPSVLPEGSIDIPECNSTEDTEYLQYLLSFRPKELTRWFQENKYPQNILRNIARQTLPTEYVICSDIDMIITDPTQNLDEFVSRTEQENCTKCAYVIPVYEVKSMKYVPSNKEELLGLVHKKLARAFHMTYFAKNQGLSELKKWEKNEDEIRQDVAYIVAKYEFFYEPIYLARNKDCPLFQERFVGYGMTRNTQVYEMFLEDWKFFIMKNLFLVHWGFTNTKPAWRHEQCFYNSRRIFPGFLREMVIKYDKDPLQLLKKYKTERGKKYTITANTITTPKKSVKKV